MTIEEKLEKAAKQLAGIAEEQITKADVSKLIETAQKLGPEGLRKASQFMSPKQRTILTNALKHVKEELAKGKPAHEMAVDNEPHKHRDLISRKLTPGSSGADTEDEKLVKPENADISHQGDTTPEGIEGQVIKANEMTNPDEKQDADMAEKIESIVAEHKKDNAEAEAKEAKEHGMEKGSRVIGLCKSGKAIMSHFSNGLHKDFGTEDHKDAADAHRSMMNAPHVQAQAKLGDKEAMNHHMEQSMRHHGAMLKCEMMAKDGMAGGGLAGGDGSSAGGMVPVPAQMAKCMHKSDTTCPNCKDKAEKSEDSGAGDTQTLMRSTPKPGDAPSSNATQTLQLSRMAATKCMKAGLKKSDFDQLMKDLGHMDDGENRKAWDEAQAEHVKPEGTTEAPKNPEDKQSTVPPKLDKSEGLSAEAPRKLLEEESQSAPPAQMKKSPELGKEVPKQLVTEESQVKPPADMRKGESEGPMAQHEAEEGDATQNDPKDAKALPPEMAKSVKWDWNHQLRSDRGGRNAHYPTNELIARQEASLKDLKKSQGHFAPSEEVLAKAQTPKVDYNEMIAKGQDQTEEQVQLAKSSTALKGKMGRFTQTSFSEEELVASLNLKGAKAEAFKQVKAKDKK